MEFTQVVENRYSCKNFSGRKVEAEKLQAILEAGRVAPTAKNLQEQRVYVVQSEEGLKKIDAVTPCRYGAPTCLVVAFDKNHVFTYPGEKRDSGVEDASIVATHMMLAAANAGVDSCWLNFFDPDKAAKELGLPENEEVLMILDLGYAAEGVGRCPTTPPASLWRKRWSTAEEDCPEQTDRSDLKFSILYLESRPLSCYDRGRDFYFKMRWKEPMNSKSLPLFRGELALCIAVLMNSFGVVLMLYSGAGISAISSVPFAFSEVWPVLTLGTWTLPVPGVPGAQPDAAAQKVCAQLPVQLCGGLCIRQAAGCA